MRQKQGKKAGVNPILCKGDGLCNAKCPTGAIKLKHFTDEEILSQIDAAACQKKGSESRLEGGWRSERLVKSEPRNLNP